MFIITVYDGEDLAGHIQILIISPAEYNISKVIKLRESSWLFQGYIKDNKLIFNVQPMRNKLNILYI
jgi:hypothetical protein